MAAIVQDRYGPPESLRPATVPRPVVGPDQVLVAVHAAGIDRGTWHLATGRPYVARLAGIGLRRPKNRVAGRDVAGRVVAVGDGVSRFAAGDEVFGIAEGSFATYAVADADKLALRPAAVAVEAAAVAATSGITALQALTEVGRLAPGQRVLVIGASGGVGTFAVQLAKALGAGRVTAVAGTANAELVRAIGADEVIDHRREHIDARSDRYDLVVDIGGRNPLRRLLRVLAPTGTLVIVGGEGGNRVTGGAGRQLRGLLLSPFVRPRLTAFISREHHESMDALARHLADGSVVPAIGARWDLAQVPAALRALESGVTSGKSLVLVDDTDADPATA
ncbi:MAG: NAD(P)-dependent alcohol dehydrogenase [Actinobacteria bacterium]|nr:NAD(P)-dependent alcohol dehydrogenase [Actinomycetota bacterium]